MPPVDAVASELPVALTASAVEVATFELGSLRGRRLHYAGGHATRRPYAIGLPTSVGSEELSVADVLSLEVGWTMTGGKDPVDPTSVGRDEPSIADPLSASVAWMAVAGASLVRATNGTADRPVVLSWLEVKLLSLLDRARAGLTRRSWLTLVGMAPVGATYSELELETCEELLGITSLVLLDREVGKTMLEGTPPVELRYGSRTTWTQSSYSRNSWDTEACWRGRARGARCSAAGTVFTLLELEAGDDCCLSRTWWAQTRRCTLRYCCSVPRSCSMSMNCSTSLKWARKTWWSCTIHCCCCSELRSYLTSKELGSLYGALVEDVKGATLDALAGDDVSVRRDDSILCLGEETVREHAFEEGHRVPEPRPFRFDGVRCHYCSSASRLNLGCTAKSVARECGRQRVDKRVIDVFSEKSPKNECRQLDSRVDAVARSQKVVDRESKVTLTFWRWYVPADIGFVRMLQQASGRARKGVVSVGVLMAQWSSTAGWTEALRGGRRVVSRERVEGKTSCDRLPAKGSRRQYTAQGAKNRSAPVLLLDYRIHNKQRYTVHTLRAVLRAALPAPSPFSVGHDDFSRTNPQTGLEIRGLSINMDLAGPRFGWHRPIFLLQGTRSQPERCFSRRLSAL
ncbi:hypothetical protein KC338_g143 [Hortaea werneckii]|nr:hypothetical protein KC338_g143 [Hortaea werneckii]